MSPSCVPSTRYLMRTVKHPVLLKDPDVLQFLESSEVETRCSYSEMVMLSLASQAEYILYTCLLETTEIELLSTVKP